MTPRFNSDFEVLSSDGWKDFLGVAKKPSQLLFCLTLLNGDTVSATKDHIFFVGNDQTRLADLHVGDPIATIDGPVAIQSITEQEPEPVYDLIEVNGHQFCINNGILSKNCDELAAINPRMARSFWTAIRPTLSTGGSCIITSTPQNDEDQFSDIWRGANNNLDAYGNLNPGGVGINGFFPIRVPWYEHPDRDETWAETERASLGPAKFAQEHELMFVSDADTLINPMVLTGMKHIDPIFYTGTVRWYREPEPNHAYLVGLDPSLGTDNDFSAIQVFQLPEMIQVAEWQHNRTDTRRQVTILLEVLYALEGILMDNPQQIGPPEIYWTFENKSIGESILQIVEDTGEERFPGSLVTERRRRGMVNTKRVRKGLNTNARNRLSAFSRMKTLIETNRMIVHSHAMVKELKNFVTTGATFRAKPGEHDDLIMATVLVVRMIDIVLAWGTQPGTLRDYISDDEFAGDEIEPMVTMIG